MYVQFPFCQKDPQSNLQISIKPHTHNTNKQQTLQIHITIFTFLPPPPHLPPVPCSRIDTPATPSLAHSNSLNPTTPNSISSPSLSTHPPHMHPLISTPRPKHPIPPNRQTSNVHV